MYIIYICIYIYIIYIGRLARPRRIIIPDLRNHGDSPHARSMSYLSMAMDVVSLLDKLDIDRSCIIGVCVCVCVCVLDKLGFDRSCIIGMRR